jgi:SAM-dependent methyltransferase
MKSLGPIYHALLTDEATKRKLHRSNPKVPFFSTVTSEVISKGSELGPDYWVANLTRPVRFSTAVRNLLSQEQNNVFLEIGPHSTLAGPLRQICSESGANCLYVPTMLRNNPGQESLLSAFGQLYQHGLPVDLSKLNRDGNVLTDLPTYPWEHNASYWYETRVSQDWRFRKFGHHGLLGLRVHESTGLEPSWRNVLNLEDEPWIADHKIREDIVFPFAGYIAMAGEAVRQISGVETGYSLRHTIAHTALVLNYSKSVEIITTLKPHRITDSADSEWYDFVISSYSGSNWIKNCEGQVRPRGTDLPAVSEINTLPRKVTPSKWYGIMADIGLVYGPEFRRLTHITSSTTENLAMGELTSPQSHQVAPFLFHPASIDASLQLLLAALAKGLGRGFGKLCVPTIIEELEISRGAPKMDIKAWSSPGRKNLGIDCSVDGKAVLRLRGLQLTPMDDEKTSSAIDRYAAARLEWCPDFDFMDISKLFVPPNNDPVDMTMLEEMTLLCMLDSAERLKGLTTKQPHFLKFRAWLDMEIGRAKNGTYPLLENSTTLAKLSRSDRLEMINDKLEHLSRTSEWALAVALKRICENIEDIFTGKTDILDLLMQDDILSRLYDATSFGHGPFVRMLSHSKPMLRILEVGGGTGGTTETFLRDLVDTGGYPMYSLYSFTDISAGFFPQAKERFKYAANMDYRVFDISKSPFEQGFEAESYDLILAPNVVHATSSLLQSLSNLKVLLKPNGHLVLTELCAVVRHPNYMFGNFSGWWLGEEDGRPYEPYISVERWDQELKAAGFSGVVAAKKDAVEPYQRCAAIVSQPALSKADLVVKRAVTLLCDNPKNGVGQNVLNVLEMSGFVVSICKLGERPHKGQDIISALDLESHFFQNITEERFNQFQDVIHQLRLEKILWLTCPAQVHCKDPRSAYIIGVARAIRCELGLPFITLEIDPGEVKFPDLVMQVFNKVLNTDDAEYLNPDREYVVDNGVIKLGRYHPFSLTKEVSGKGTSNSGLVKSLHIEKLGQLQTLSWKEETAVSDLHEDEVEIESRAVGLNFKVKTRS